MDPAKLAQLRLLFASLSDADVASLAPALKGGARTPAGRQVHDLLGAEREDRALRDQAFAPLAPLVRAARADPTAPLPPETLHLLWRTLRRGAPDAVEAAVLDLSDLTRPDDARRSADALAMEAHDRIADGEGAWGDLRAALDARRPGAARILEQILALTPLARACAPRMRAWIRTASLEHASGLRLAYRDAAAFGDDAPPRLLDMLAAQLEHPWHVLRLVAAVMDRPRDSFLSASELARFGEQVLDRVDDQVQTLRAFDPGGGAAAGETAARAVCDAVLALAEFERSIDLRPDGPWARRLAAQRRNVSRAVETRLKQADGAMARALPVVTGGLTGRLRGSPRLDVAMDPVAKAKASAHLAFAAGVRTAADFGGFAVIRAKALEALDERMSAYADDLVRVLHDGEPEEGVEARDRLGFLAEGLALVRDRKAADVIRRRVAAAAAA